MWATNLFLVARTAAALACVDTKLINKHRAISAAIFEFPVFCSFWDLWLWRWLCLRLCALDITLGSTWVQNETSRRCHLLFAYRSAINRCCFVALFFFVCLKRTTITHIYVFMYIWQGVQQQMLFLAWSIYKWPWR